MSEEKRCYLLGPDGETYPSRTPGTLGGYRRGKENRYGRLDCPAALRALAKGGYKANRVFFADEAAAIAAGFRPCASCMPEKYKAWKARKSADQVVRDLFDHEHQSLRNKCHLLQSIGIRFMHNLQWPILSQESGSKVEWKGRFRGGEVARPPHYKNLYMALFGENGAQRLFETRPENPAENRANSTVRSHGPCTAFAIAHTDGSEVLVMFDRESVYLVDRSAVGGGKLKDVSLDRLIEACLEKWRRLLSEYRDSMGIVTEPDDELGCTPEETNNRAATTGAKTVSKQKHRKRPGRGVAASSAFVGVAISAKDLPENVDCATAAAYLGISGRRVRHFIESDPPRLPSTVFGGAYLIKKADLIAFGKIERSVGRPP